VHPCAWGFGTVQRTPNSFNHLAQRHYGGEGAPFSAWHPAGSAATIRAIPARLCALLSLDPVRPRLVFVSEFVQRLDRSRVIDPGRHSAIAGRPISEIVWVHRGAAAHPPGELPERLQKRGGCILQKARRLHSLPL
jgi:hypothetical protein